MRFINIEAERVRNRMSKADLAKALGVSCKTLYNWEHRGNFPLPALLKMSEMFGCTIDYLVESQETETKEEE